ncbi:MAG: hypothetical protein US48_C0038G0010 [Candidatus Levybacteria bacterium GW2011_GWA2_37_36]|nr:MAG: hypothetical protein US43_C0003G0060 [Candidatus Levybacteria bacterium GW2011_GWA1_37_16]KKQ32015.1 MAG: hypothetical protein US48_C0038G0010 [Candidatus Levybacteria bacterium GW2011_GWA2_37_36]
MAKNNINLHILNASGKLTPYLKEIKKIFDEAVVKVVKKIPLSKVDVVVSEYAEGVIPELGVGGNAYDPNVVSIYLNSKFPNFVEKTLKEELKRIIPHELSHSVRSQAIGYGETLLNAMISEGLADHFDIEINHKGPHLWDVVLNANQIREMMEKAKKEYNNKNYNHYEWFFGSKEKNIPRWTGYALGFNLVAEYLKKNPDRKVSQLYNLAAEEFIK